MMAASKGLGKKEREKSPLPSFFPIPLRSYSSQKKSPPPLRSLCLNPKFVASSPPAKKRDGGGERRKEKETQTKGRSARFAFLLSSSALGRKRRTHSFFLLFFKGKKNGRAGGEGLQQRKKKKKDIEGLSLFVAFVGLVGPGWGGSVWQPSGRKCASFFCCSYGVGS